MSSSLQGHTEQIGCPLTFCKLDLVRAEIHGQHIKSAASVKFAGASIGLLTGPSGHS